MVWYHLYTDITPPPFIGLSHDFFSHPLSQNSPVTLTVSSLSGMKKKRSFTPPRIFFAHKHVRGHYGTTRKAPQESKLMT